MTLKLLQDMEVFNVDILFTFLNVYSLDSNNDWHHLQLKFQHFLKPTTLRCEFCESLLKKLRCLAIVLLSSMSQFPLVFFGKIYWRNACRQNKNKRLGQSIKTTHKTTRPSKIKRNI